MRTRLTSRAASVAGRVGLQILTIEELDLGTLVSGTWNGHELHESATTRLVLEEDGSLALHLEHPRFVYPGIVQDQDLDREAELRTSTGTIRSRFAYLGSSSFGTSGTKATLYLDEWVWSTGVEPVAWVGSVEGARIRYGDLSVTYRGGANLRGQVLDGAGLRWHLWPRRAQGSGRLRRDRADAIIQVTSGELDARRVATSLGIAGFVLGSHLRMRRLVGVDATGHPVRAFGIDDTAPPSARVRRPVPESRETIGWHGDLFRRVADAAARDGDDDITYLVTEPYLDALANHIDGGYLATQVGLEAFTAKAAARGAISGSGDADERMRVKDKRAWLEWVDRHRDEITSMARDQAAATALVGVLGSVWRESSSSTVARFFMRAALPLPDLMLKEIRGRNRVAHELLMTASKDRDFDRDLARLSDVQALLVAALASFVGYQGPIAAGYNADGDLSWWPHRPTSSGAPGFTIPLDDIESGGLSANDEP